METKSNMIKTHEYNTDSVISNDGTVVGYRIMGSGPGVILNAWWS